MSQIVKHEFEAVSLLTTDNGMLNVTVVPALNQPDWMIPSGLILGVEPSDERIWNHLWQQQEVAIFHLLPRDERPDKVIILEGNTAAHRIGLQTAGELQEIQVRLSDVKDAPLPESYYEPSSNDESSATNPSLNKEEDSAELTTRFKEDIVSSYLFQTVIVDKTLYLIPDLDKIAHQLVDLDT